MYSMYSEGTSKGKKSHWPMDSFQPRGFLTNDGYVGFLPDGRRLTFPTYDEYLEFVTEEDAA